MHAKDVLKEALISTQNLTQMYFADLSDQELLVHPVPSANHIAWQMGHLINSEVALGQQLPGAKYPDLPASLKGQTQKMSSRETPPGGYLKKADYLDWFNKVRGASIAAVERMSDADLDKPTA